MIVSPPFDAALVARLERMQEDGADWDAAPDKFAVSVNCADGDISVSGGRVFLGAGVLAARCDPVEALPRLMKAARDLGGGRMRALVAEHGEAAIFAAAGLHAAPATFRTEAAETFGVAFGLLGGEMLRELAAFADAFGTLLLTPRRAVTLNRHDPAARAAAARSGLLTDAADPRARVVACAGMPACAAATVPAREDAAFFARLASDLHVSGCSKGCARSAPSAVTLVGRDGLYDLVRDGRADGAPVRRGLTREAAAELLAAP